MGLFKTTYKIKVPFEDLDPMSVVWHGNYMRYMEQARCDLLSKLNYTYRDMKADGYAYPVAKMNVKYIKPAIFDEILTVETEILSLDPALEIKYIIYNENKEKIFEAYTMQISIDINTKESIYTPPERFVKALKGVNSEKN